MPSIVGWVAFQFHKGTASDNVVASDSDGIANGWATSGRSFAEKAVQYSSSSSGAVDSYVPATAWGQAREIQYGVDREYGGIGSSGGPQHSGRADHRLITVQRNTDKVSPVLFKHCCNGYQIRRMVFVDTTNSLGDIIVVAENCHVVTMAAAETRFFKDTTRYNVQVQGQLPSLNVTGAGADESTFISPTRAENISILYTRICVKVGDSDWHGWDTGTETSWNSPNYTIGPPLSAP